MVTSTQGGGDVNCRDGCHVELSDNQTLVIISADKHHVVISRTVQPQLVSLVHVQDDLELPFRRSFTSVLGQLIINLLILACQICSPFIHTPGTLPRQTI